MGKRRMLFIVWLVVMLCVCWCCEEEDNYLGNWDVENFSRYQEDAASNVCDFASEKAVNVNNKVKEKAHDAYDSASDKAGRVHNTACDMAVDANGGAKHEASEAYYFASQKVDDGMNTASLSRRDALDRENDEACEYEDAKSKVYEAYKYAKDTMTEQAKKKYEAAKEKASDAAGNLGQKMRTGSTEL